eukprot:TRINITY_DN62144_c0_g1_i1.p1 TRINITY_DN62144_c0_g1~~TRINITY_DN62144_c0_g1_i1.p1  ORF type:complete len:488 (+),score=50.50 TRINITY_DN62144_c0_g1_i1:46-1509(+)
MPDKVGDGFDGFSDIENGASEESDTCSSDGDGFKSGPIYGGVRKDLFQSREVFVWPPLDRSRFIYRKRRCCCIPMWMIMWGFPMCFAGFGFFLQNFQLRLGTYYYVHTIVQRDLRQAEELEILKKAQNDGRSDPIHAHDHQDEHDVFKPIHNVSAIHMSFGKAADDVAFGALHDQVVTWLGAYTYVKLSVLDFLAILFPMFFGLLVVTTDNLYSFTRICFCFFCLAVGKGLFSWITTIPDSSGWKTCQTRLAHSVYSVEWFEQERSVWEILFMDPRSRLCADMMWSGHTYFVTLFALGLHEATRIALRTRSADSRVMVECLVAGVAFVQQGVEIYFVLKSRFHYTSDVVMAVIMTYLLYTNTTIAFATSWWVTPSKEHIHSLQLEQEQATHHDTGVDNRWVEALRPPGMISLGCCFCCSWSQQWIYSRNELCSIIKTAQQSQFERNRHNRHFALPREIRTQIKHYEMKMLHSNSVGTGYFESNEDSD